MRLQTEQSLFKRHPETCDMLLTTGLPNKTNITGRINTAVTLLVIVAPTSNSVYRPPAGLVSKPCKHPNANVSSASYSGNFTGFLGTSPSLVSILVASLSSSNYGNIHVTAREQCVLTLAAFHEFPDLTATASRDLALVLSWKLRV